MSSDLKCVALFGAGFSRNWGGWLASEALEFLLGCPQMTPSLRALLLNHRHDGGYEGALGKLQEAFYRTRSPEAADSLKAFEAALARMFDTMNKGFASVPFEFQSAREFQVGEFLTRFDALFTLNLDLLLEQHYFTNGHCLLGRQWNGWDIVGVRRDVTGGDFGLGGAGVLGSGHGATGRWVPGGPASTPPGFQPYFKLHGSCNWRGTNDTPIMVGGVAKEALIDELQVLPALHRAFVKQLTEGRVRVVVIGYSFSDPHINRVLTNAASGGTVELFIVDPMGLDILDKPRPVIEDSASNLIEKLGPHVRGASRRSLPEIFGGDAIEHAKISRFVDGS